MITNPKKENSNLYSELFKEITDNTSVIATCIEDVFENMPKIREEAPRLTRLSLEEEFFDIDLDSRVIKVPAEFAKNGVSVVGDHVAEFLYFRCDRYFDNVDLANKEIYIEYINADGTKKYLPTTMIDLETEPRKIIFEWPITNIASAKAGNLQFSVRFCSYDDEENLTYSLATLIQTVKINNSLALNFADAKFVEGGLDELMLARLDELNPDLPSVSKVSIPEFASPLTAGIENLGEDENEFTTQPINLYAAAVNDEGGILTYYLYKDGKKVTEQVEIEAADGSKEFVEVPKKLTEREKRPTEDTFFNTGKKYFKREKDGEEFESVVYTEVRDDKNYDYFEEKVVCEISEIGEYQIAVTNQVRFAVTEEVMTPADGVVKVPAAAAIAAPVLEAHLIKGNVLDGTVETKDGGKITYAWKKDGESIEDATEATFTPEEDGFYTVVAVNNLNKTVSAEVESNKCRVTDAPSAPELTHDALNSKNENYISYDVMEDIDENGFVIKAEPKDDASRTEEDSITYKWYKFANGRWAASDEPTEDSINDAKDKIYNIEEDDFNDVALNITTANLPKDKIEAKEYYYCLITNTYNNNKKVISSPFFKIENEI